MNETMDLLLDMLADEIAARLAERMNAAPAKDTYTVEELAERYSMSKDSISRKMRAGEFGETINAGARRHLVTAEGVRAFDEARKGPAHTPRAAAPRRRKRGHDPGPI